MSRKTAPPIPGPLGRGWGVRVFWLRPVLALGRLLADAGSRVVDIALSVVCLTLLSPLIATRAFFSAAGAKHLFERQVLIGRFRAPFSRLSFAGTGPGRGLAVLFNILRGEMSWTGPRPLTLPEEQVTPVFALDRFQVRPGLVSPFWLREKTGVAYDSEFALDRDYVYGQTLKGDLGLLARSVPATVLGGSRGEAPPAFSIFGVPIVNGTFEAAVSWILDRAERAEAAQVAFVNPDCLNVAYENAEYRRILQAAALVLPDGIGIHLACRMLGTPLLANVNGTDLFPKLCEEAAARGVSLYLLGARPGIASAAGDQMKTRFPALEIAGARDGYFSEKDEESVLAEINGSGADILLVAMGAPRQDLWLAARADRLKPAVRMGVGGLFDFYSGRIPRAPVWMREIGLEWVYRLLQEPGRMWRRYVIGNPVFLLRVARELGGRGAVRK